MSLFRLVLVVLLVAAVPTAAADKFTSIQVDPTSVSLSGPEARYSLLIAGKTPDGRLIDLTGEAKAIAANPRFLRTEGNVVRALADGTTTLRIEAGGKVLTVPVQISGSTVPRQYHFVNDIEPLFGRFGCNASGCHGKAEGQNGFKLSVFGFDPAADYAALVMEARGRRVFPAAPERSLLLAKASGQVPHGGGIRFRLGSDAYETVRGWIAAGAPMGSADAPSVERIRVEPAERILDHSSPQQLRVIAHYSDGREVDVTHNARFQSNNDAVAAVGADGLVQTSDVPGEAAVMASFANQVSIFRALVPRPGTIDYPNLPCNEFHRSARRCQAQEAAHPAVGTSG